MIWILTVLACYGIVHIIFDAWNFSRQYTYYKRMQNIKKEKDAALRAVDRETELKMRGVK